MKQWTGIGLLALTLALWPASAQKAQKATAAAGRALQQGAVLGQPDAQRTKNEFQSLLNRYPPSLRGVFEQDPNLMTQEQYLAPYPALANFLGAHPEIALNPAFYLGARNGRFDPPPDHSAQVINLWQRILSNLVALCAFGLAAGVFVWMLRTFLDERRWNRLSRVQADVHTKLLDRFSTSDELMAYIATPAGSKFLQSAPIAVGTGSRGIGAPLNRIMWSVQAGLVLAAAGIGLMFASGRVEGDASQPLQVLGILAMALGAGFAVSAGVAYLLSQRMGLLDSIAQKTVESGTPRQ